MFLWENTRLRLFHDHSDYGASGIGIEESLPRVDSSIPLMHHDPSGLGLSLVVKKAKIHFEILRIQSWIIG